MKLNTYVHHFIPNVKSRFLIRRTRANRIISSEPQPPNRQTLYGDGDKPTKKKGLEDNISEQNKESLENSLSSGQNDDVENGKRDGTMKDWNSFRGLYVFKYWLVEECR